MSSEARAVTNSNGTSVSVVGNTDTRLHDSRKVWIASKDVTVVGVYGPGTSWEITSNWHSPLENFTLSNLMPSGNAILQQMSGLTMTSVQNTLQAWENNSPYEFNVELQLYALSDPEQEVMKPLAALEYMMAPDIHEYIGAGGKITEVLQLSIGKRCIFQNIIIRSMSIPFDKETDSQGNFVRCTVNLSLCTITMISRELLKQGYGLRGAYQ